MIYVIINSQIVPVQINVASTYLGDRLEFNPEHVPKAPSFRRGYRRGNNRPWKFQEQVCVDGDFTLWGYFDETLYGFSLKLAGWLPNKPPRRIRHKARLPFDRRPRLKPSGYG